MSKLKLLLSVAVVLIGCWFVAKGNVALFVDSLSIIMVALFGSVYAMAGTLDVKGRIKAFGDGALLGAWLGASMGLVGIFSKGELFWNNPELDIFKALAIVSVCLFWGYFLKLISFLIAENWQINN